MKKGICRVGRSGEEFLFYGGGVGEGSCSFLGFFFRIGSMS